jgi:adenosylhomocysteine nucleosidase
MHPHNFDELKELSSLFKRNPLYVFAMTEEAGTKFSEVPTLITGLGKVNATYSLTKRIIKDRPGIIINLGSAGSSLYKKESVVCCTKFVQRDMNVTALGFENYKTPFSPDPAIITYGFRIPDVSEGICGSGDNFETNHNSNHYNVVDMEGYALALIAMREQIPFLCLKYITDGADGSSATDWQTSLKNASRDLKRVIEKIGPG